MEKESFSEAQDLQNGSPAGSELAVETVKPGAPGGLFRFCPSCGSPSILWDGRFWHCDACGFEYFHNVAAAAGLILKSGGSCLFLRRAKEPRLGCLALPGGFVDPDESAEAALLRECQEELGWAPKDICFLASYPNRYSFKGVEYWTCDLFFIADITKKEKGRLSPNHDESTGLEWIEFTSIPWESIAFESTRQALRQYLLQL